MWSARRTKRIYKSIITRDNVMICHLSGRVAELTNDDDERKRATDLFRAMTKMMLIERGDRTTEPDDEAHT